MKSLQLKNFRCLKDTGEIDIKPLTFLVGANSSGKSSFLKFFPLLRQSARVRKRGVFLWNYHDVDLRDFKNTVREGAESIEIGFTISNLPIKGYEISDSSRIIHDVHIDLTISGQGEHYDYLSKIEVKYKDQYIQVQSNANERATIYINGICMNDLYIGEETLLSTSVTGLIPIIWFNAERDIDNRPMLNFSAMRRLIQEKFSSSQMAAAKIRRVLNLVLFDKSELKDLVETEWNVNLNSKDFDVLNNLLLYQNVSRILQNINEFMIDYANTIEYIRPLRATVERYYRFQNYAIDEIDSNGENLAMYLYNLSNLFKKRLDAWTERLFNFTIEVKAHEGHVELGIKDHSNTNGFHNLVDVGFGYTQLLPILVVIWKAVFTPSGRRQGLKNTYRRIIVIEQPELHLHPKMQMLFADMLAMVINSTVKRKFCFIIETHSETIINRIGEIIAENKTLTSEDVNVILFHKDEEGNSVSYAKYDNEGFLENWPIGFFSGYAD